jgi:pimeloyl-ACP methyl ester carboxylesterase
MLRRPMRHPVLELVVEFNGERNQRLGKQSRKVHDSSMLIFRDMTLVLLPGFLCDETVWRDQLGALAPTCDCLIPGYGHLDSLAAMAGSVLSQAPARFAVAGHSMGGRIALEIFRQSPGRVTHVALFDTGCHARPADETGAEEERGRRKLLAIAREQGMRSMAANWIPPMIHPDRRSDAALVERIVQMMERKTPDIFEAQMNALLARPEAGDLLPPIQCPALILTGSHDVWSPPVQHEEMAAAIPNSTLVIVPDCGHMSTMERPDAVARAINQWLAAKAA